MIGENGNTNPVEGYVTLPQELRDAMAITRGRAPVADNKVVKVRASEMFPVSAAIAAEKAALEQEAFKNPEPGDFIEGQGVFLGKYAPKDRDGNSLGKVFNVFAAPEDLTDASGNKETYKYVDAVKRIAALKNWNGHDGTHYATDEEIYNALKDGSYDGGWIIPTSDLLNGKDVDGNMTQPDNLYAHQDKLKGPFTTSACSSSGFPVWYWSSTEDRGNPSDMHIVRFSDGNENWTRKDKNRLSCRLVRLVEVKP